MINYESKFIYLTNIYGSFCPIAYAKKKKFIQVTDLHHMCHNTKWRKKKFPLFINSVLNLLPVSNEYHLKFPSFKKISDKKAEELEEFLTLHPQIARFANNPEIGENYEGSININSDCITINATE